MKAQSNQTLKNIFSLQQQSLLQKVIKLNNLTKILETQAKYNEAFTKAQAAFEALETVKKCLPAFSIPISLELQILSNLGKLARILGKYATAQHFYLKAINLAQSQEIEQQRVLFSLLNELAIVCKHWGNLEAAEQLYQTLLKTLLNQYGEKNQLVAVIYHNLASLEHCRGHDTQAEYLARKSYELHVQLLGKEHADTIANKAALGCILHGLGRWDEAIELFQEAIDFFDRPSHRNSYEVAINLNNLAAARVQAKGELQAAEKAYRRALDIKKKLLGSTHPEVAITLNNLAMLLKEKGKIPEAKKMLEQALIIFEKSLGYQHPKTILCQKNLNHLYKFS